MLLRRWLAQMNRQHGHIRRGDAADAEGLAEAAGGKGGELLAGFSAQTDDASVVEGGGMSFCSIVDRRSICFCSRAMYPSYLARISSWRPTSGEMEIVGGSMLARVCQVVSGRRRSSKAVASP